MEAKNKKNNKKKKNINAFFSHSVPICCNFIYLKRERATQKKNKKKNKKKNRRRRRRK